MQMYPLDLGAHDLLISVLSPVEVYCDGLYFLQREASLMNANGHTDCGYKDQI